MEFFNQLVSPRYIDDLWVSNHKGVLIGYIYIYMSRYKCWMYNSMYIVEIKLVYIYIYMSKIINIIWRPKICIYRNNHNYIYVQEYDGGIYWGCPAMDHSQPLDCNLSEEIHYDWIWGR